MTEPTTLPFVITSNGDLDANLPAIEKLAQRFAQEFIGEMGDLGDPETLTRDQAAALVMRVLRELVLEEPSRGEGVDIAGTAFDQTFRYYRAKQEAEYASMTEPTTATETKIIRVTRREFYDSFGEIVYFLRVPAGMTAEEVERHNCWRDGGGIDAGETHQDGISCVGRIDDSDEMVAKRLEPTRGADFYEIREVSEEEMQGEVQ